MASAVFHNLDTNIGCNNKEDAQIRRVKCFLKKSIYIETLQCVPMK